MAESVFIDKHIVIFQMSWEEFLAYLDDKLLHVDLDADTPATTTESNEP